MYSKKTTFICYSQLRDAFIYQLTQGYSHYDRQLRNDLLVLAAIIASKCPEAPFVETGFAKQLVLFSTFQEGRNFLPLQCFLLDLLNEPKILPLHCQRVNNNLCLIHELF